MGAAARRKMERSSARRSFIARISTLWESSASRGVKRADVQFLASQGRGPAGARGHRAYVVGDIHGRLDLLDELLGADPRRAEARPARKTLLVFVGDLIDRGPRSAQVVERLRTYRRAGVRTMFILGNHEEVLLRILSGDAELITKWRWFGGSECLQSYGVDAERCSRASTTRRARACPRGDPGDARRVPRELRR